MRVRDQEMRAIVRRAALRVRAHEMHVRDQEMQHRGSPQQHTAAGFRFVRIRSRKLLRSCVLGESANSMLLRSCAQGEVRSGMLLRSFCPSVAALHTVAKVWGPVGWGSVHVVNQGTPMSSNEDRQKHDRSKTLLFRDIDCSDA